jgi:positive regulator of sigma E activity
MEEHGIVIKKKESTVVIKAARTTSCDNCASKKSCTAVAGWIMRY